MNDDNRVVGPKHEEGDIGVLIGLVWRHRVLVAVTTLLMAAGALFLFKISVPIFHAESVITEVRDKGLGANSSSSDIGGIAALVGFGLGGALGEDQTPNAILNSQHLAQEFIRRRDLIPVLLPKAPKKRQTMWWAVKAFKERVLVVRKDARKGTTVVAMDWKDPAVAARWANDYVALCNELIRTHALDEATRNIAYLNEQLAKTTDVELRAILFALIQDETKTQMLANGRIDYAFQIVDPAVAPELKARPHGLLMLLIGIALGVLCGSVLAVVIDRRKLRSVPAQHAYAQ